MRMDYEAAAHNAKAVRTLYEDDAVQDRIRQIAARLYRDNPAMRIAVRDADDLLLPMVCVHPCTRST